jgi:halocyanin-like protein
MNRRRPSQSSTRRSLLTAFGSAITVGALAGCTDEGNGNGNGNGDGEMEEDDPEQEPDPADDDDDADMNGDEPDADMEDDDEDDEDAGEQALLDDDEEPDYDGWFDDTENYEGTVDLRGEDDPVVVVGSGDQGFEYEPPAIMVDPGTTVIWEWTGEGGAHDVSEEDGEFESDLIDEEGEEFEHDFADEGVYQYICTPHEVQGMVGAVAVGDADADD